MDFKNTPQLKCALRIFLCFLFVLLSSVTRAWESAAFYYGDSPPYLALCQYDLVVIDPTSSFNPQDYCTTLSTPIAYVSVGEVASNAVYDKLIPESWVLGHNKAWNNNKIIDQTQSGWHDFFIQHLIEPLWQRGYRGFFLDTLDSYFLANLTPQQQQQQVDGMALLIQQIKTVHPDAQIIVNRGFQLLPQVQSHIDAVTIESIYAAWNQARGQYEQTTAQDHAMLLREIARIQALHLPIIGIDYLPQHRQHEAPALAAKLAKLGVIPWVTDKTLQAMYLTKEQPHRRHVLVLFDQENSHAARLPVQFTKPVRFLGSVLEYLGFVPHYYELRATALHELKKLVTKKQYAGVIIWLENPTDNNKPLLRWLISLQKKQMPLVFLHGFGVPWESHILHALGISVASTKNATHHLKITHQDTSMVSFEAPPPLNPYEFISVMSQSREIVLQLMNSKKQREDAVAITPWGGYALHPNVMQLLPNGHVFWIINPFVFFDRALQRIDAPIPDTTTENGRRLLSVHIDGDGFSNQAKWIDGNIAAVELRDKILNRYPIPTSFSVITGDLRRPGMDPERSKAFIEIARSIFALPWVESASHSYSHPLEWQTQRRGFENTIPGEVYGLSIPHYIQNYATEITDSVAFINTYLVPPQKPCRLFFWSGFSDPSQAVLAMTYADKLLNINGLSATNIDRNYHSMTNIQPMGIQLGEYIQVFAPIDMDFNYMGALAGPLYGFERVIETWQMTDAPRRMKPIDIYYHIYAASYPASLQALYKVYDWAMQQSVMPVYISDYIKKVLDYYQLNISKRGKAWLIYSHGDLRELRASLQLGYPDLMHSQNVIGFNEKNGQRYIHLGPHHLTVLQYQTDSPKIPYLVDANARVTSFSRSAKEVIFHLQGYVPVDITLAQVAHCKIVSADPYKQTINSDQSLHYHFSKESVEIHIQCKG